jgi:disabled family protein 2
MIKLKALVVAKKEHKQRICIKVTLEGVEILDEKTNQPMFNHSVNKISYIARDVSDSRAIGYIYKNGSNSFQYFAIKTLGQAQELFNTLKELFEVVLEMRNKAKQNKQEVKKEIETVENVEEKAPTNDPEISGLQDKIKQMNEQPAPSLLEIGSEVDGLGDTLESSLRVSPLQVSAETPTEPKKPSSELFDLFDTSSSTTNSPPVDPRYNVLANEISNLNNYTAPSQHRTPPVSPQPNPNPFQMPQAPNLLSMQQGFNQQMQMPAVNNPFNMNMQANQFQNVRFAQPNMGAPMMINNQMPANSFTNQQQQQSQQVPNANQLW